MPRKILLTLSDTDHQNLLRLAAYCGYIRPGQPLSQPNPAALLRAVANLPPEQWDGLLALIRHQPNEPPS